MPEIKSISAAAEAAGSGKQDNDSVGSPLIPAFTSALKG